MRRSGLLALLLAIAPIASSAPIAWVCNFNTTMDVVNVANNNFLPYGSSTYQSEGLARSAAGQLYITDANGMVWDVTGGAIPMGPTGKTQIGDLDWNANGLWGFSNASSELFFYDLGSSSITYSATISGTGAAYVTGVAYENATGDVYLSGNTGLNTDALFRVPNASSSAQTIGSMAIGDAFSFISDIDFDQSGTLYAMTWFHRHFYTVSTSSAATTLVSIGPHKDTTGMALDPVPEPATIAVLFVGASGLAGWRRRRSWAC